MKAIVILVLACTALSTAQQRILVSPNGDARALTGRESAAEIVRAEATKALSATCSNKGTFGYSDIPNARVQVEAFHRDIMAMWYLAPGSGTIDTVFVYNLDVGTLDSTVTVRLFHSNIYPGSGPGYDGYPMPGKLCWGYYLSTNDNDNGLAAFPGDATDTTWHSTVTGAIPSFSPMGTEIWGYGGFPKIMHAFTTNFIAMSALDPVNVTTGEPFFITIRMYGPHVDQANDHRTGYVAASESDPLRTHDWKFYEHVYQGPGFTCPGWISRGDFNYLIWYSMSVTTNLPPSFSDVTTIGNTLSTGEQVIQATIIDCDAAVPSRAGVKQAVIRYALNDAPMPDVDLAYLGGDTWEGAIPGRAINDRISYRIVASDSTGIADSTAATEYRVVSLANGWYAADTGAACVSRDIRGTGSTIAPSAFFVPSYTGSGTLPKDDGTAGPFDMGHPFTLFGDTFRYAWIGVNGGLALSKAPGDTLDVNSNGFGTLLWDFPNSQKSGRTDTAGAYDMPGMFIAPFWADMIVGSGATDFGRIVYGNGGDSCLFIAEWDSLGSFSSGSPVADATTFRAVLDRCTGAIDFQYDNVGTYGLAGAALVGMQADSNGTSGPQPGWIYINRSGAPDVTAPRNGWCVRLHPTIGSTALDGWNMIAASLAPIDGDYSKEAIFPPSTGAVSPAYRYAGSYLRADSLKPGPGYWLKFGGAGRTGASGGSFISSVSVAVQDKWNMVGGPSGPVATSSIVATGTTIESSYFGYGASGYYSAGTIQPGYGYWVKVSGDGTLDLSSSAAVPMQAATTTAADVTSLNSLTFRDAAGHAGTMYFGDEDATGSDERRFELPPPPPAGAFDVRYASQRYVETIPAPGEGNGGAPVPVTLSGAAWPLTMTWEIRRPPAEGSRFTIGTGDGGTLQPLEGTGSLVLRSAPQGGLAVRLAGSEGIPSGYSLGEGYPNPFNPTTRFEVGIAAEGAVAVAVYDLLGREIRTLVRERRAAGVYTLEWDGRDGAGAAAPSGVYIVRMTAGKFSAVKKVVLMK